MGDQYESYTVWSLIGSLIFGFVAAVIMSLAITLIPTLLYALLFARFYFVKSRWAILGITCVQTFLFSALIAILSGGRHASVIVMNLGWIFGLAIIPALFGARALLKAQSIENVPDTEL